MKTKVTNFSEWRREMQASIAGVEGPSLLLAKGSRRGRTSLNCLFLNYCGSLLSGEWLLTG